MKRTSTFVIALCTLTLALGTVGCGREVDPNSNVDPNSPTDPKQPQCPPTGAACVAECPANGTLPGGAPCQRGSWDEATCTCQSLPAPTCSEAGGLCGSLTATGVLCDVGLELDANAGSCAIGGACCMPAKKQPCPLTGLACTLDCPASGQLPGGAPCVYGLWNDESCGCDTPTCQEVGGTCGSLTAQGTICAPNSEAAPEAGTCGIGGACCLPTPPACPPSGVLCAEDCPASGQYESGAPCQTGTWNASTCLCE